ncbi:MAG: helix-turn-helix domain-containing protein [Chloroflexota bacterium]
MSDKVVNISQEIDLNNNNCPVTYCIKRIGGKWKPIIIFMIRNGANRFGIMQRSIEGISKQMLTKHLRELEADGILERTIYAEIPPRVEYSITAYGETLMPIIDSMSAWGLEQMAAEA